MLGFNSITASFIVKLDECLWHLKELHKPEESFPKTGSRSAAAAEKENVQPADQHAPPPGLHKTLLYWHLVVTRWLASLHWRHLLSVPDLERLEGVNIAHLFSEAKQEQDKNTTEHSRNLITSGISTQQMQPITLQVSI